MPTMTFDPNKQLANFAGIPLNNGVAPDTFFELEFDEDGFETQVGASGEVTRSLNQNKGAKFKCTLMAASPINDALSAIYNSDRLLGNGIGEFQFKELNGTTLFHGPEAWVVRLPNTDRAKAAGTVQWTLQIAKLEGFVGGLTS